MCHDNILLPDSTTNEAGSHGFVKFYVKQKQGNAIGSALSNKASIFFDFNAAIVTNESRLIVTEAARNKEITGTPLPIVRPNPAHERVELLIPISAGAIVSWELFDLRGSQIRTGTLESSNFFIERNGLPAGVYLCHLRLKNGVSTFGRVVFD